MSKVTIGHNNLTLEEFEQLLFQVESEITLDEGQLNKIREAHQFLSDFAENKVIYGVNTGFGPMAQYIVPAEDRQPLQYNLIRSHSTGMGEPLGLLASRATTIARLKSLMTGHSGIHEEAVVLLRDMLQNNVIPVVYSHGGVGASGDLVQLAHVALALIGEGKVYYQNEIRNTSDVLTELQLQPMHIHIREGLALMNGTSAMTGIGLMNILKARRLLSWSIGLSSMLNEIVEAFDDHFSELLNDAKQHPGQIAVAAEMRNLLAGSKCIKSRKKQLYAKGINGDKLKSKLQEYYSIRCVPQILGPIYDTIANSEEVLLAELNSSNDNPLIFSQEGEICHGGNFHGDYVSLEMDKLKLAIAKLSMLSERQLNYLLNDKLNDKLPPFINRGRLGFNFGMQGCQFTATSTVAENQMLSNSMYVHSIPCNNDNQDIVSMGTNAALMTQRVIDNAFDVLAIQTLAVVRSVAYLGFKEKLAPKTSNIYSLFEGYTEIPDQDIALSPLLGSIRSIMTSRDINS